MSVLSLLGTVTGLPRDVASSGFVATLPPSSTDVMSFGASMSWSSMWDAHTEVHLCCLLTQEPLHPMAGLEDPSDLAEFANNLSFLPTEVWLLLFLE